MNDSIASYYRAHSWVSDPEELGALFIDLPGDVAGLCRVVQGLVLHYCEGPMYGIEVPRERVAEVDTRCVSGMLQRITELDDRSLRAARAPGHRLVGCCRDFSLLLCSMLRQRGVPARLRFGFSSYFRPDFLYDHVLCEYWNEGEERWMLLDPQMDDLHCDVNDLDFEPLDVPRDRFLLAGEVWRRYRDGEIDPQRCGANEEIAGPHFIGGYVVHDLAALNREEVLCWDAWGMSDRDPSQAWSLEDCVLLDELANLELAGEDAFAELRGMYERHGQLRVGDVIASYSPAGRYVFEHPRRVPNPIVPATTT